MKLNTKKTSPRSKNSGNNGAQTASALVTAQGTASVLGPVIERLRASQMKHDEQVQIQGVAAGRAWAEGSAEAVELKRLDEAEDLCMALEWDEPSEYSHGERFFFTIRPEQDGDCDAAAEFWEAITGTRETPELIYVHSFAATAVGVWNEVEDRI